MGLMSHTLAAMSTIVTELCVQSEVRAETEEIAEHQSVP